MASNLKSNKYNKGTKMPVDDSSEIKEAAFKQIRRNVTGFLIWRVENMHLVAIPKDQYGTFHTRDSYLVYAASEFGKSAKPGMKIQEVKSRLEIHVHFWLGTETTKEDSAIAAYKCVELDTYLSGAVIQHREVQGRESARFRGYFKTGMRLLKGGVSTGAQSEHGSTNSSSPTSVQTSFQPRLYRVKGRRSPIVTQMPSISWEHFNSGEVFILDTKDVVFLWVGKHANNVEKLQATNVALRIKDEHHALSVVFVDDGKETELPEAEKTLLGVYLDTKIRRGLKIDANTNGMILEENPNAEIKLYKCSDEGGTYRISEIKAGPLQQTDLDSNHSYIIDKLGTAIWTWVGKNASPKERTEAIRNAHGFVKKKNYQCHIPISRVIEGGEPIEFRCLFNSWKEQDTTSVVNNTYFGSKSVKPSIPAKLDTMTLHTMPRVAAETQLIDNGGGKISVWRIRHTELCEIPCIAYGRFYTANCYLVHYKYTLSGKERHVLYQWIGRKSSNTEQCALSSHATVEDESVGGIAVYAKVMEGREPPHFLAILQGRFIVFSGDHKDELPQKFMLHIKGNKHYNTKAYQVPVRCSSLNTNDVFVLRVNEKLCYVWCGKGSTGDEREMAKNIANKLTSEEFIVLFEGQEKEDFWATLGGSSDYTRNKQCKLQNEQMVARLFHCVSMADPFKVEEIMNFGQDDLIPEDIMLLDIRDAVYVWIGSQTKKDERRRCINVAKEFLRSEPSGKDLDTPVICVKQSHEPPTFTGFFQTWDTEFFAKQKSFAELRSELEKQNPVLHVELKISNGVHDFDQCEKFSTEKLLVKNPEKLPPGVDPTMKEVHLTHDEFVKTFGMKYSDFSQLPQWRKDNMKKAVGLF